MQRRKLEELNLLDDFLFNSGSPRDRALLPASNEEDLEWLSSVSAVSGSSR